jgi:type IV secretion system protein TrbF
MRAKNAENRSFLPAANEGVASRIGCMFRGRQSPESLPDLGNMPPALMDRAPSRFASKLGNESVHGSRWFVFSMIQAVVIVALGFAVASMMPLKTVVPYMVSLDPDTGQLRGKPVAAEEFRAKISERHIAAEARAFVRGLMTIDPFVTRSNLSRVATRVTGKANTEFKEFLSAERPFERLAKTPGLVRTAENITVDASQKNVAFVFVQTAERVSSGEPIITKWRFTLHYVIDPAVDERGIDENPLGFVVKHFERVQDFQK